MLRQLRAEARLTQEELAEAAGLSPRSISDLERGVHLTAHKDTGFLAGALGLAEPVRAAVRRGGPRPRVHLAGVLAASARGGAGTARSRGDPDPAAGYRQLHRPRASSWRGCWRH